MGEKWIVNAGSVGRPKDGDNRASYVRLQIENNQVHAEIRRIAYDVEKVALDIENSGLDSAFGDFLRNGGEGQADEESPTACPICKSS